MNDSQVVTEGNLVNISGTDEKSSDNISTASSSTFKSTDETVTKSFTFESSPVDKDLAKSENYPKKNYARLCGYLNKFCNRGILKTFRKRWFVFSENNCKLYYYRQPQDQVPLGEIDISEASFSFDVSNKERPGLFMISVPGRDYFLEANNRKTCLFWLQELQKFRRANSLLRTEQIGERSTSSSDPLRHPQSGLLARLPSNANLQESAEESPLMLPVDCPGDEIGDNCAVVNTKHISVAQQKFNSFRNQVMNSVTAIRHDKSPSNLSSPSSPDSEVFSIEGKTTSTPFVQNSTFFSDNSSQSLCTKEANSSAPPVPNRSNRPQAIAAFKMKLSSSFRRSRVGGDEEQIMPSKKLNQKDSCGKCQEIADKMETLMDDVSILQDELSACRDVISVLQKQLDIAFKERETLIELSKAKDPSQCLEILSLKDQEIVNLNHNILEQKQEVETLQNHVLSLKKETTDLEQKSEVFIELLQQKDKTIMTLTNELFDLETEKRDQQSSKNSSISSFDSSKTVDSIIDTDNIEHLKDGLQAFELQNKFLNKEILELNELRRDAAKREEYLSMKCSEWEARSYQIQSKLLFLLKELDKPEIGGNSHEVISRLLQEAMGDNTISSSDRRSIPSWSNEKVYDELGFNWKWGKADLLSTKAANLKQRSEDMTNKAKDIELVSLRVKWDNYMVALGTKDLQRTPELKILIRQGIPREYKGKIWKGCAQMKIKYHKMRLGPNYYENLLTSEEFVSRLDPSSKQIELDLLRTLPNNRHYENLDSDGIPKLRRVLLAYSRHDPSVGYCQGLNRLAAIALLFMDEEDAFWCLVAIIKYIMPEDYYSRTLIASQVDQRVLKDLMADKLPRIHMHLEQNNVDLSLFTFNWFLTVFVDNIPVETYLRIWDVFLYEGNKVLFRYSLAIFKLCENEILQMNDYMAINRYLRSMAENMTDIKRLGQIAFNELNPFPLRTINTKRAQHMQIVKAQLEEFESIRRSLPRNEDKVIIIDYPSEED